MNIRPQADEFLAYAADHSVVPVWTEVLGDLETPVSAFLKLVDDGPGFLLESVENGERWSRFSFIGRDPVATLVLRGEALDIEGTLGAMVPTDQGILEALEALLSRIRVPIFQTFLRCMVASLAISDMTSSVRSSTFLMLLQTITACLTR